MNILELSGDTGSTRIIAEALAQCWRRDAHHVDVISPVRSRWTVSILRQALSQKPRYDCIHTHLGTASIVGRRIGRLLGIPVIATLHGFQKAKHYRGIRHFTAVSHAVKQHYVRSGLAADTITVIPNGWDPGLITPPASLQKQTGRLIIGTVGTLSEVKQHGLLIESMREVAAKQPQALLLIAGAGKLEHDLRRAIDQYGLNDHVRLLGYQANLSSFYHQLDLYVQTSREEGFCIPLMEAMACSKPVLTTSCKGPDDYISNGINGIISHSADAAVISQAILSLLADAHLRERLAAQAAREALAYQWPQIAAQYASLIKGLISC